MKNLILISLLFLSISSCCKTEETPFYDKDVSSHGWALYEVKDANDNIIIEKPDSLAQDIYFFFTNDFKVIGHIASFKVETGSSYNIKDDQSFSITKLLYPELIVCCEWDQYFLDNYKTIDRYDYQDGWLMLYFKDNSKFIFISK